MPRKKIPRNPINCVECGKSFVPHGTQISCSSKCAAERQLKCIKKFIQKRKEAGPLDERYCQACGGFYIRGKTSCKKGEISRGSKYGSAECAANGLQKAIDRQTKRRQLEKKAS